MVGKDFGSFFFVKKTVGVKTILTFTTSTSNATNITSSWAKKNVIRFQLSPITILT